MLVSEVTSISMSPLERERFGIVTARAYANAPEDSSMFDAFCKSNDVEMLIVRASTSNLAVVQRLEEDGSRIMDCLVYYQRDLKKRPVDDPDALTWIGPMDTRETDDVIAIAQRSFSDYQGHYHADPRLDRTKADDVYKDWARRSCSDPSFADGVLVARIDGKIAGFTTLKRHNEEHVEAALVAVAPEFQGHGVMNGLIAKAAAWAASVGAVRCISSTQISNVASQKGWIRAGFEPVSSYFTLHKWYSRTNSMKAG